METRQVEMEVNGERYVVQVKPKRLLVEVLREEMELTGTKRGCDWGVCGVCTVLLDGMAVNSCLVLAVKAHGRKVTTIEGLARQGCLDPLQEAFITHGAIQCGYCTPGLIMMGKAFLDENPNPTEEEVREALIGNLCRCTGYVKVVEAILAAAPGRARE